MSSAKAVLREIVVPTSWQDAYRVLSAKRGGSDSYVLENNTTLERRERPGDHDAYAVKYHDTDIVTWEPDGTTILRNGGWFTSTTKERIDRYTPVRVFSDMGRWFVCRPDAPYWGQMRPNHYEIFREGFRIGPRGGIAQQPNDSGDVNEALELRDRAAEYAEAFIDRLWAGEIDAPGPGDCWYCSMVTVESGETLGDAFDDTEHLRSHIEQGYYVPSLMMNAQKAFGSQMSGAVVYRLMTGEYDGGRNDGLWKAQTFRALTTYLARRLGFPAFKTPYRKYG